MAEEKAKETAVIASSAEVEKPKKLRFHYIKSNYFRSIHADGVFGGATPSGHISATFFNERRPLPDQTVQTIKEDGHLGDEIMEERIERDGVLRELEANIIMNLAFAKTLADWLNSKIQVVEKMLAEDQKAQVANVVEEKTSDAVIG